MFRRRLGVLLLTVAWISVTTPSPTTEGNARPARQLDFGECCPCSGGKSAGTSAGAGRLSDTELEALPDSSTGAAVVMRNVPVPSVGRGAGECPCCQREADSAGAASGPVPSQVRAAGPFMIPRPADPKEESKPLLHPEVGLASSFLETLREATDEEYRDALERDAARSAAAEEQGLLENSSEAARNIVTIVLNPTTQSTERVDDAAISGTHLQESRCIHSPLESAMTVSQQSPPKNLLEDIVSIPRFQPSGLSRGKLLLFDENPAASEVRESFSDVPEKTLKPPLLKLLPDNKLHLDKRGVKDLIKVYRISKDILDENIAVQTKEKSSNDFASNTDFGINSKISDLNERIDQLNDLNELAKIPQLKIDGKYSKVAKGADVLEDSEEITNADSLQAPSDRELTASPSGFVQRSNVPDRSSNPELKEGLMKLVPDLVKTVKHFLKLKDVELIPSKTVNTAEKASQANIPNFKLFTLDELVSKAKSINLKDLIPGAAVATTTPGPVTDPDFTNDVPSDFMNVRGQNPKFDFDNSSQNFETEIIDVIPSPSVIHAFVTKDAGDGIMRASADASECKVALSEETSKESKSQMKNNEEVINQEIKEASDDVTRQEHFSNDFDEDFDPESSGNADRSLDVDRGTGLKLADNLDRLSDKIKKSELKSQSINSSSESRKNTEDAESGTSEAIQSSQKEAVVPSKSATANNLPTRSASDEKMKTAEENVANDHTINSCNTNIEKKSAQLKSSKTSKMASDSSEIVLSDKNPFKRKPTRLNTVLNKLNLQATEKAAKTASAKKADMSTAASETAYNFFGRSNPLRLTPTKPSILKNEPNLQAPGPWTLWSGLDRDPTNKYPHVSPEKFRDLFEGLSRARVNYGITGVEVPTFPEWRSRLKSPFRKGDELMRQVPFSGLNFEETAIPLPSLYEMRLRAQEFLSSPKLRESGIPNIGNLRVVEPLKHLEEFRDGLQKNAADVVNNLQQTLSSTLNVAKMRDENILANSLYAQPENVLDAISRARFDVDDRLKSIHTNVMDRLSSINDQLSSMDPTPLGFPKLPNLKSAKMQEKSASENIFQITSPRTPLALLRSDRKGIKPKSQSKFVKYSTDTVPIRLPKFDAAKLPQLPYLPWNSDGKIGSENNDKFLKILTTKIQTGADKSEQNLLAKPLPIVKKTIKKPADRTHERTSTASLRNSAPRPVLRVKPLQPTPEIKRTQIKRPSQTSPETRKWKIALISTPSPRTNTISKSSAVAIKSLLKSPLDESDRSNLLSKLTFDPKERLRASLKSQRDSLGSSSHNIMSKPDSINERLKNNLALHRQKARETAKPRTPLLKPMVKVNISKMELPERTAFKDSPTGKVQKRDSETEEDGESEQLLAVKPLEKAPDLNDLLDKLRQSVKTTLSSVSLRPTLMEKKAGNLQLKPDMMESTSDIFKAMVEQANEPMKENFTYQCKMVCNKE